MENQKLLEQISKKLSVLLALNFSSDIKKKTMLDNVQMLLRFDLSNQEISDILGTTRPTVEVIKSRIKKAKK